MTTGDHGPVSDDRHARPTAGQAGFPTPVQFQPERTHIFAALVMVGIALLVIGAAPLYLGWLLVFPALFIFWVLRSRTTVGERGIGVRYAFRPGVEVPWEEIRGVGFKGSSALLETTGGRSYSMPGVTFNSLPKLAEASRGRIPDALTAGLESLDGKFSVINQDGHQVLMSREEHAAYMAERVRREQRRRRSEAAGESSAEAGDDRE